MPKINVYLSDELAEAVKEANLPVSAICQRALEHAVRRMTSIREMVLTDADPGGRFSRFTDRARNVLALALDDAHADGRSVDTEHLLAAMLTEGNNLALRVLKSMEIEPAELAAALDTRRPAPAMIEAEPGGPQFAEGGQAALRGAVTEATGLGHNYVGCEHLLLGLITEPDGIAGQTLRGAGADLRLTRRAVTSALAGYVHLQAQVGAATQPPPAASGPDMVALLAAAVREQLAPILTRLERLEQGRG